MSRLSLSDTGIKNWIKPVSVTHTESQFSDERVYSRQGFITGILKFDQMKSINYGFSTQRFGNMGFKYGQAGKVIQNRKRFLQSAGLHLEEVVFMRPNHETTIMIVESSDRGKGAFKAETGVGPADALITFEKKVALGLNSADCVPIIVTSKNSDVLALIHAGRIGTDSRITAKVIKKLSSLGFNPRDLIVGIGPSVQKVCYKLDLLKTSNPTMWFPWVMPYYKQTQILIKKSETDGYFYIQAEKGKIIVDILGYNIQQLIEAGVDPENIDVAPVCSTCFAKKGELYSHSLANLYKKSNLYPEGRFMVVAMLK